MSNQRLQHFLKHFHPFWRANGQNETRHGTAEGKLLMQSMTDQSDLSELTARAACLVNPESGIANDFLNHFNEILLLIENLPMLLPEMVDELLQWQPITYADYFRRSPLPGSRATLERYHSLGVPARAYFDKLVEDLNMKAVEIVERISAHCQPDGSIDPDSVSDYCAAATIEFRGGLDRLAYFVNCGYAAALSARCADDGHDRQTAR